MAGRFTDLLRGYVRRRAALYVCVAVVFLSGMVTGGAALNYVTEDGRSALAGEVQGLLDYVESRPVAPPEQVLRRALVEYVLKLPVVIGLLGLSIIGAPLVLVVIFVRGFVLGFTMMFLIDRLFVRGFFLAVAALLPQNLLAVPAVMAAGTAAMSFSLAAARVLLGRRDISMYQQFITTGLVLLCSCIALIGAAFVEAYVSPVLMNTAARFLM